VKLTELFTRQLESETSISRRVLGRVPEGRPEWRPHEKSMALGYLATLVATMPTWVQMTIDRDELDLNPPGGGGWQPREWKTTADLQAMLEESVDPARRALAATSEEHLETTWRLLVAGQVVDERPRGVVIADIFAHTAHHRGQLTVYLRLNDAPVPSVYGPSADDKSF